MITFNDLEAVLNELVDSLAERWKISESDRQEVHQMVTEAVDFVQAGH